MDELSRQKRPERPKSAEHDFYESLAANPQYYDDSEPVVEPKSPMAAWVVLALALVGLLIILVLIGSLSIG